MPRVALDNRGTFNQNPRLPKQTYRGSFRGFPLANTKSAEKQNRRTIKRTAANNSRRSEMRTAIKKVRAALASKTPGDDAQALLKKAVTLIDRAGGRQLISRNTSARLVSRLTVAANAPRA